MNNLPDDTVPLTGFMLESENNLAIAHAIHEHYPVARRELLNTFFGALAAELRSSFPDWKYGWNRFLEDQYAQFKMWKPAWNWRYLVEIQAQGYGSRMVYGVWRDERRMSSVPRDVVLYDLVCKKLPHVLKPRPWYEAEIVLTSPAADWRLPEVLWRMSNDDAFLQEVASLLRELANVVETRIDELVAMLL